MRTRVYQWVGGSYLGGQLRAAVGVPSYKTLLAEPGDVDFLWLSGVVTAELC